MTQPQSGKALTAESVKPLGSSAEADTHRAADLAAEVERLDGLRKRIGDHVLRAGFAFWVGGEDVGVQLVVDALVADRASIAELVRAARVVAFEDQSPDALKRLDLASEAFAEAVPWDDEPEAARARQGGPEHG